MKAGVIAPRPITSILRALFMLDLRGVGMAFARAHPASVLAAVLGPHLCTGLLIV